MNQNTQQITNNYYVDAESLIAMVAGQEQTRLISFLKSVNAVIEKEDGLYAVAYVNFQDSGDEDHTPEMSFVKIGEANSEQN